MCFGPLASAVMNGRLISYSCELESAIFAFSASSLIRWIASGCLVRSMPLSFLNSLTIQSMTFASQSSPPRFPAAESLLLPVHFHLHVRVAVRRFHDFVGNAMFFFVDLVKLPAHETFD